MSTQFLLFGYCALILLASVAGGLIPLLVRLTHQRLQLAISLVAGVMLGVGLLHMLPHALLEAPGRSNVIFACVLGGFLAMFFIERFFCFHHHDVPMPEGREGADCLGHSHDADAHHDEHVSADAAEKSHNEAHRLSWIGAAIGLTLHTIFAGIALAASIEAESRGANATAVAGFGTFVAILLHKPFDAMTITTLMTVGAWKKSNAHLVNALFALMVPVGVGLFYLGLSHASDGGSLVAYALAFSAGTFLCVSMSDLLPELQFHTHDRVALSMSLLLGLSVAGGVTLLEEQNHDHASLGHPLAAADHGSSQHGHARYDKGTGRPTNRDAEEISHAHDQHDEARDHAETGHADEEMEHNHAEDRDAHAEHVNH